MEVSEVIVGKTLRVIEKTPEKIRLVFDDSIAKKSYIVTFDGILLETANPSLNKKVKHVRLNNVLGVRTVSELRSQHKNPMKYRQILIQMEGSTDDNKLELLGAFKENTLSSRKRS